MRGRFPLATPSPSGKRVFYLDDGADSAEGCDHQIEVNDHGLAFCSPWSFPLGTQLILAICRSAAVGDCHEVKLKGVVVACTRPNSKCRRVTVLFDESSPQVCRQLAEIAPRNGTKNWPAA